MGSEISTIQIIDSAGHVKHTFAAPFKMKEGAEISFSVVNSVLTITGTAVGVTRHSQLSELDYVSAGHTGFAQTLHVHAESDVANLITDLAGKAALVHSHAEGDVTNLVTDLAGKQASGNYITALTSDVTASGPGSAAATIAAKAVTYAKIQDVSATSKILGRKSSGAGSIEELSNSDAKTILVIAEGDVANLVTDLAGKSPTSHTHLKGDVGQLPTDFGTQCALWLRADLGITMDGNNKVSVWADQSGHGRDFTQGNPALAPVWTTNYVNGKPSLIFTANNLTFLANSAFDNLIGGYNLPYTLFIVMRPTLSTEMSPLCVTDGAASNSSTTSVRYVAGFYGMFQGMYQQAASAAASARYQNITGADGVSHQIFCAHTTDGHADFLSVREGGKTLVDRINWQSNIQKNLKYANIGAYGYGSAGGTKIFYFQGSIAEIILFVNPLSEAQIHQIEEYLVDRYGVYGASGAVLTPQNPIGSCAITTDYTPNLYDHHMMIDCLSASCTITLPNLLLGWPQLVTYMITRDTAPNAFTCTVAAYGTQKIQPGNLASIPLTEQYQSITLRGAIDHSSVIPYWEIVAEKNLLAYGSMYGNEISQLVTIAATDTYYFIPGSLSDGGSSADFAFQNAQELKCNKAGTYLVAYSASINCATDNQDLSAAVMVNTTAKLNSTSHHFVGTGASTDAVVAGTAVVALALNDLVRLSVANYTATNNITVEHVNLTITQLR